MVVRIDRMATLVGVEARGDEGNAVVHPNTEE